MCLLGSRGLVFVLPCSILILNKLKRKKEEVPLEEQGAGAAMAGGITENPTHLFSLKSQACPAQRQISWAQEPADCCFMLSFLKNTVRIYNH